MIKIISLFILLLTPVYAQELAEKQALPKYELGLGLFAFRLNDYRGSDQSQNYYWPIPYINYRSDDLNIENSLVRGNLLERDRFRLGLSMMATPRVNSKKNRARAGMPALDPTLEMGPVTVYDYYVADGGKRYSSIGLAVRSVFAVEFWRAKPIGFFSVPFVTYTFLPQAATANMFWQFSAALMLASQRYHSYFYEVNPEYATPDRPVYKPEGGYSGAHVTAFTSKKFDPFYVFGFFRYDRLTRSAFEDSPLVKRRDYYAMGLGLIWYFYQAEEKVKSRSGI